MDQSIQQHIEHQIGSAIKQLTPVSGGDISKVFKIETPIENYLVKLNSGPEGMEMFRSEILGLDHIRSTKTIAVPEVKNIGVFESTAVLILSYIESKLPSDKDFEKLGQQLASLHLKTHDTFGFKEDNYIGSLPQSNTANQNWIDFYITERLAPQFELAKNNRLLNPTEIPDLLTQQNTLSNVFSDTKPSLLHGDLWSGNYLIALDGTPYLIDPSVYYGHNEVDIAMSLLFGGFSKAFYSSYQTVFPFDEQTKTRIEMYQLYYLLVHLNLFGNSYHSSVSRILKAYF